MKIVGNNLFVNTNYNSLNSKCNNKAGNVNNTKNFSVHFKSNALDLLTEEDHRNAKTLAEFLDSINFDWRVGCHNSENTMVYIYKGEQAGQYLMQMNLLDDGNYMSAITHIKFSKDSGVISVEQSKDYENKLPLEEHNRTHMSKAVVPEIQLTLNELSSEPTRLISGQW